MTDVSPDVTAPARFLKELWGTVPSDWIAEFFLIQYRPSQENPDEKKVQCLFYPVSQVFEDWTAIEQHLQHLNRTKVFNIHPCVNPRFRQPRKRGGNKDVSHYVALWIDVDFHGEETAIRKQFLQTKEILENAGLPPSVTIESGHGLHAYWLLDKPYPSSEARPCCAGLQDTFKISDIVNDPSRVLRLPGTLNLKDPKNPGLCRIIEASYKRYPLEAFAEYAIDPKKSDEDLEEEERERRIASLGKSSNEEIERIKQGVDQGDRDNAAAKYAGWMLAKGCSAEEVESILLDWNKLNRPPLSDEEILKTAKSIHRSERENHPEGRKKKKTKENTDLDRYFDGRTFLPEPLSSEVCLKHKFIATPIGDDGLGTRVYIYRSGAFRPGGESLIVDEAYRALAERANENRTREVVKCIRISRKIDYAALNRQARNLINVRNGMLDWKTGTLSEHDPKHLSTIQIAADYDSSIRSDPLDRFLEAILPPDEIPVIEEFLGYLLLPDTSFNKCLVVIGEGGNGKTTLLNLLIGFLGEENVSHYSLQHISEEKFSVAGLFGSLANFYDELQTKQIRDTSTFKIVTGGSPLKAEDKGKAPFSFRPFCRLVFSANEMPRADDRSQAYFDRFIFIQLPNRIRGTGEEVREYHRVLLEMSGVRSALLNRAISGLRRLTSQGRFTASTSSLGAIEEYRRECNSAYDFVREHCTFEDPTGWIAKQILYDCYRAWCGDNTRKAMSSRGFGKSLEMMNVRSTRHGDGRGWGGILWANGRPPETSNETVKRFGETADEEGSGKQKNIDF